MICEVAGVMRVAQSIWTPAVGWTIQESNTNLKSSHLVFLFGERRLLSHADQNPLHEVIGEIPASTIVIGCSTAGEIAGSAVRDGSITLTAVEFDSTRCRAASAEISRDTSRAAGRAVAQALSARDLLHVFVLSEGLNVNGSELVAGLREELPPGVQVTGGLSGDGADFRQTGVWWEGALRSNLVVAVGFYGLSLRVGYGSKGGWDPFGPDRLITRSVGNVLYELDGKSALGLYKTYLGEYAKDLPASGLLFPLLIHKSGRDSGFVRTILAVDEETQSLIFAGDVPQGSLARFMKANFDRLIDGASGAAEIAREAIGRGPAQLAILISCVGRKLVLKQRTEEEVEAVRTALGPTTPITGFYSYGEISPLTPGARCDLHNQTMTVTTFAEA